MRRIIIVGLALLCLRAGADEKELVPGWTIKNGAWLEDKGSLSVSERGVLKYATADIQTFQMKGQITIGEWKEGAKERVVGVFWGWSGSTATKEEWNNRVHFILTPNVALVARSEGVGFSNLWRQEQTIAPNKVYPFQIKIGKAGGAIRIGRTTVNLDKRAVKKGYIGLYVTGAKATFSKLKIKVKSK
ncbi:MAG: hypothetical protein GXP25_15105 [Planctomycetes bacterium]|nr:hypothetical protein [Planctomycetota bacterium]